MKLGIIGGGNLTSAIVKGAHGKIADIIVSDMDEDKIKKFASYNIKTTKSNIDVVLESDFVILAVKPNHYKQVLNEIKPYYKGKVIITVAPGISIRYVKDILGDDAQVIRTGPNTPVMLGEGMTVMAYEEPVSDEVFNEAKKIFDMLGKTMVLEEYLMDAAVPVSGGSPAYVFMFIEAMADAAVLFGIPRDKSYILAAQSVLGAAKLVLETGEHPGALKDMVCSPGGTTIEAVHQLEKDNMRASIMNAMIRSYDKAKKMSM